MRNFLDILQDLLKQDIRITADDGTILKSKLYDLAMQMDSDLLKLLFGNKITRDHFFKNIDGIYVFDKIKFLWIVNSKEFLADSFTIYKNKIGLGHDDRIITDNGDVALVWPYKDCILEGGQTKEDQKRDEIFFNELLAPDEVNRLLYPKVFTNAAKYSVDGVEDVDTISSDDNLIIKGNNLLVMASLLKKYEGKIKCIYIDPPYYFDANKKEDTFAYNSNFKLSTWLTFMKNRLEIARKLLSEDGSIFVQISDDGVAEVHRLLKEIFNKNGRNNFINKITVKTKSPSGFASVNAGVFETAEYILCFAKNKDKWEYNPQYVKADYDNNYKWYIKNKDDNFSSWEIVDLFEYVANIKGYENKKMALKSVDKIAFEQWVSDFALANADKIFQSTAIGNDAGKDVVIARDKSKLNKDKIYKVERENHYDVYIYNGREMAFYSKKIREIDGVLTPSIQLSNIWIDTPYEGISKEGNVTLKGGKKPEKLIKRIIDMATNKGDIVLDYHLGSGTTCAVAHKMGRRYIGIEQLDYGDNDSVIRMKNVINGDRTGISRLVNWTGGGSFIYCELKELNEKFIDKIQKAKSNDDFKLIWDSILSTGFISHKVRPQDIDTECKEFIDLSIKDKRNLLVSLLDKNMLYVNLCDIDDVDFEVSQYEKNFTKSFYGRD